MKIGKTSIRLVFLAIIATATFGAGLVDVIFPDVVPLRPYTGVFHYTPIESLGRQSVMSEVIIITLAVALIATLVVAIANRTTGLVIAHSGFTPNTNLTSTPGASSVLQLYPLIFAFLGLIFIAVRLRREEGGV